MRQTRLIRRTQFIQISVLSQRSAAHNDFWDALTMKYKFLTRIGILAALAICHSVVHASTIAFDDTSNAYDNAWTTTSLTAIQFTATATGVLQQLGLSFTTANGPSALATIQISTDNSAAKLALLFRR